MFAGFKSRWITPGLVRGLDGLRYLFRYRESFIQRDGAYSGEVER